MTESLSPAAAAPQVQLFRLDCGHGHVPKAMMSDTFRYDGTELQPGVISGYLVRHGDNNLLWDAGLSCQFLHAPIDEQAPFSFSLTRTIVDQLAELGIEPRQITHVALSHVHFDHVGQASDFPHATLLVGRPDLQAMRSVPRPDGVEIAAVLPWIPGDSNAVAIVGDHDVFGDGSVTMLHMPGHTEGHYALLVRLPETGPVLLAGDLWHAAFQIADNAVSARTENRAAHLASQARALEIADVINARIIIPHECDHVALLPAFPDAAQ